jgi:hypothetical protein
MTGSAGVPRSQLVSANERARAAWPCRAPRRGNSLAQEDHMYRKKEEHVTTTVYVSNKISRQRGFLFRYERRAVAMWAVD